MLWRIDLPLVTRDANSQARVHQAWTFERSEVETFRTGLRFRSDAFACVWMEVNGAKSVAWPPL